MNNKELIKELQQLGNFMYNVIINLNPDYKKYEDVVDLLESWDQMQEYFLNKNIVERLRECWCSSAFSDRGLVDPLCDHDGVREEAADEIEKLREQNEYLKANVEMLLAEARQSKHGIDDIHE